MQQQTVVEETWRES